MIKVNKAELLSALIHQAHNDTRYCLNGFFIDVNNSIVATDGHRMFVGQAEANGESVIISLTGKPPAKFEHAEINVKEKNITYFLKGVNISQVSINIIDGRFPDWERVAKITPEKVNAIGLNMRYLSDAAKCAKMFNKHECALIETSGTASAVKIKLSETAFIIIMPARI